MQCASDKKNDPSFPNLDKEPYSSLDKKKKTFYCPRLHELRAEVSRRVSLFTTPKKVRPSGWTVKKCMHWLVTNANLDDDDITFLHKAESDTRKKLVCLLKEEATQRSNFDEHEETAWYGAKPWLR